MALSSSPATATSPPPKQPPLPLPPTSTIPPKSQAVVKKEDSSSSSSTSIPKPPLPPQSRTLPSLPESSKPPSQSRTFPSLPESSKPPPRVLQKPHSSTASDSIVNDDLNATSLNKPHQFFTSSQKKGLSENLDARKPYYSSQRSTPMSPYTPLSPKPNQGLSQQERFFRPSKEDPFIDLEGGLDTILASQNPPYKRSISRKEPTCTDDRLNPFWRIDAMGNKRPRRGLLSLGSSTARPFRRCEDDIVNSSLGRIDELSRVHQRIDDCERGIEILKRESSKESTPKKTDVLTLLFGAITICIGCSKAVYHLSDKCSMLNYELAITIANALGVTSFAVMVLSLLGEGAGITSASIGEGKHDTAVAAKDKIEGEGTAEAGDRIDMEGSAKWFHGFKYVYSFPVLMICIIALMDIIFTYIFFKKTCKN